MNGTLVGTILKSGESEYGCWAIVAEPEVTTKAGKTFTPRVMCSGKDIPADGTLVLVTGIVMAKLSENGDKTYANLSMSYCHFTPLGESVPVVAAGGPEDDSDIPF